MAEKKSRAHIPGPSPEHKKKAERIREKERAGKTLTRSEAGYLGAMGSIKEGQRQRASAKQHGRLQEFKRKTGVESWTNAPGKARAPHVTQEDRHRLKEIHEKQREGEKLTRSEAGFLGAMERIRESR